MIQPYELPNEVRQHNFELPAGYRRVFELQLTNLEPWYFVSDEEFKNLYKGINARYPERLVVPFARRKDCDDVACFVITSKRYPQGHVIVVHDFASSGSEVDVELNNFWDWFRLAVEDIITIESPLEQDQ